MQGQGMKGMQCKVFKGKVLRVRHTSIYNSITCRDTTSNGKESKDKAYKGKASTGNAYKGKAC
jgi:hypothetical protein